MPVEILVSATTHAKQLKGEIIDIEPDGHVWGTGEQPPKYIHLTITNATVAQVEQYMEKVQNTPEYTVGPVVLGRRNITVSLPNWIRVAYGGNRNFRAEVRDYLEDKWGAIVTVVTPGQEYIVNVADTVVLQELRDDFHDKFEDYIGPKWLFTEASVDQAIAAGSVVSRTRAQAISALVDRAA